jgi:hypothetical protein
MAISASLQDIKGYVGNVKLAGAHVTDRFQVRQGPVEQPAVIASISPEAVKPQPLTVHQEVPAHDESATPYQQKASTAQVVFSLASAAGLKDIANAARELAREEQLVRGA